MRYFLIHSVRKDEIERYKTSIAGGYFSFNLIEAGLFDKVFSILPLNVINYKGERLGTDFDIVCFRRGCRNKLSIIISVIKENWYVFKQINKSSSVWLYNINSINLFLYSFLRLFKRNVKIFVILADFTPSRFNNFVFKPYINKADGIIYLSQTNHFTNKNATVIPGIAPDINFDIISKPVNRNFLLAGNLMREAISMLPMVLNVFSASNSLFLNISGRYENRGIIDGYMKKYDNICYHGVLPRDVFLLLMKKSTFVLNTRDPKSPENINNFPSKVLEALLYNRIVISTIHYPQLDGIKYFEVPAEEEAFMESLERIASLTDEKLLEFANQSDKVRERFSGKVWRNSMQSLEKKARK